MIHSPMKCVTNIIVVTFKQDDFFHYYQTPLTMTFCHVGCYPSTKVVTRQKLNCNTIFLVSVKALQV